jgi:tripartite-type tricarboxylate transporter receptor subunit TctC
MLKTGTPPAVTARLNEALNKALKTEKVRDALAKLGTDPGGGTPEAFGTLVQAEIGRWSKVIKDAGIKVNP